MGELQQPESRDTCEETDTLRLNVCLCGLQEDTQINTDVDKGDRLTDMNGQMHLLKFSRTIQKPSEPYHTLVHSGIH